MCSAFSRVLRRSTIDKVLPALKNLKQPKEMDLDLGNVRGIDWVQWLSLGTDVVTSCICLQINNSTGVAAGGGGHSLSSSTRDPNRSTAVDGQASAPSSHAFDAPRTVSLYLAWKRSTYFPYCSGNYCQLLYFRWIVLFRDWTWTLWSRTHHRRYVNCELCAHSWSLGIMTLLHVCFVRLSALSISSLSGNRDLRHWRSSCPLCCYCCRPAQWRSGEDASLFQCQLLQLVGIAYLFTSDDHVDILWLRNSLCRPWTPCFGTILWKRNFEHKSVLLCHIIMNGHYI